MHDFPSNANMKSAHKANKVKAFPLTPPKQHSLGLELGQASIKALKEGEKKGNFLFNENSFG